MTCPLLYRFRVIDRLPERPSPAATRGTVVHAVLERLFDLPAGQRTLERAAAMVEPQWQRLLADEPRLAGLFPDDADGTELATLARCRAGPARALLRVWRTPTASSPPSGSCSSPPRSSPA